jgi:hypothetical protein
MPQAEGMAQFVNRLFQQALAAAGRRPRAIENSSLKHAVETVVV